MARNFPSKFLVSRPFLVNYSPAILRRVFLPPSNNAALLSSIKYKRRGGDVHFISISAVRRGFHGEIFPGCVLTNHSSPRSDKSSFVSLRLTGPMKFEDKETGSKWGSE